MPRHELGNGAEGSGEVGRGQGRGMGDVGVQLALVRLAVAHGNGVIAGCFLAGGVGLLAEVVFYDGHGC